MHRFHKSASAFVLLVLLSACSSLGLAPAQTFNQKLAYAYGTHTAVMQAAASSVQEGSLSGDDATQVLKMADESKVILDSARGLYASGDATGANNKLALALAALTATQTYLKSHGGK